MKVVICADPVQLGAEAAADTARAVSAAIRGKGTARIVLSTGASQFEMFERLVREDVDWGRVEMFHLDEYAGLDESHPASFRKYLRERFIGKVGLRAAHLVSGDPEDIPALAAELRRAPIDVGLIGIGQNGHIAFNDPPADFDTQEAYIVVNLDDACKRQQVSEGWFAAAGDVPRQAVSMSVRQILRCRKIISCVPHDVKARAVRDTLAQPVSNRVPATILKTHPDWTLYIDRGSASLLDAEALAGIA